MHNISNAKYNYAYRKQFNSNALHNYAYHKHLIPMHCTTMLIISNAVHSDA